MPRGIICNHNIAGAQPWVECDLLVCQARVWTCEALELCRLTEMTSHLLTYVVCRTMVRAGSTMTDYGNRLVVSFKRWVHSQKRSWLSPLSPSSCVWHMSTNNLSSQSNDTIPRLRTFTRRAWYTNKSHLTQGRAPTILWLQIIPRGIQYAILAYMLFAWHTLEKLLHSTSSRVNTFLKCHTTLCRVMLFIVWPRVITFIWLVINSMSSHDVYDSKMTSVESNLTLCQHTTCIWAFT